MLVLGYHLSVSVTHKAWVAEGKRPYIDPRFRDANQTSYIESGLVKIMERCWQQERAKRIDIFAVVKFLRHLKIHAAAIGEYLNGSGDDKITTRIER